MIACTVLCSPGVFSPPADAGQNFSVTPQRFTWREYLGPERVVMESGVLTGFQLGSFKEYYETNITVNPSVEFFLGEVGYDGQTQAGTPATSDVLYYGLQLKADGGRRFRPSGGSHIEPFGGLGLRAWTRDIKDGRDANGDATAGYREDWLALYARLGARGGLTPSNRNRVYAEAGVKLPLYNENTAHVSDIGRGPDITFNPGKKVSYFAEVGAVLRRFEASLFYDSLRFSQSSAETNGVLIGFQPESSMDIYGVKLGYRF